MAQKMAAIVLIYIGIAVSWVFLGGSISRRTWHTDQQLHSEVSGLWGDSQWTVMMEIACRDTGKCLKIRP